MQFACWFHVNIQILKVRVILKCVHHFPNHPIFNCLVFRNCYLQLLNIIPNFIFRVARSANLFFFFYGFLLTNPAYCITFIFGIPDVVAFSLLSVECICPVSSTRYSLPISICCLPNISTSTAIMPPIRQHAIIFLFFGAIVINLLFLFAVQK